MAKYELHRSRTEATRAVIEQNWSTAGDLEDVSA